MDRQTRRILDAEGELLDYASDMIEDDDSEESDEDLARFLGIDLKELRRRAAVLDPEDNPTERLAALIGIEAKELRTRIAKAVINEEEACEEEIQQYGNIIMKVQGDDDLIDEYELLAEAVIEAHKADDRNRIKFNVIPHYQDEPYYQDGKTFTELADDSDKGNEGNVDAPIAPIVNKDVKVGRNEPCPCGSGKKFKKCHW